MEILFFPWSDLKCAKCKCTFLLYKNNAHYSFCKLSGIQVHGCNKFNINIRLEVPVIEMSVFSTKHWPCYLSPLGTNSSMLWSTRNLTLPQAGRLWGFFFWHTSEQLEKVWITIRCDYHECRSIGLFWGTILWVVWLNYNPLEWIKLFCLEQGNYLTVTDSVT